MNDLLKSIAAIVLGSMMLSAPAFAASTKDEVIELQKEVQALKEGQESMKSDLAEIKKLLQSGARAAPTAPVQPPFEPKDVNIAGASMLGDASAKVTLIEYSDYQCPFCARHSRQTMPEIIKNYVNDGKVKFIMREFPIPALHPRASAASEAALCARDQDKYWEMHDILFNNQRKMSDEDLNGYASEIGLDTAAFGACMEQKKYAEQVEKDIAEGKLMGVSGTPSFVLGLTDSEDPDKVRVTKFVRGARGYPTFSQLIDELLADDSQAQADAEPAP
jgi:protein-disulfide isomerase